MKSRLQAEREFLMRKPQQMNRSPAIARGLSELRQKRHVPDITHPEFGETYDTLGLFGLLARGERQTSPILSPASGEEADIENEQKTSGSDEFPSLETMETRLKHHGHFVLAAKVNRAITKTREYIPTRNDAERIDMAIQTEPRNK